MGDGGNEDRKEWAKRLRDDIAKVTGRRPASPEAPDAQREDDTDPPRSMHERVQERMREIAKDKRRSKS